MARAEHKRSGSKLSATAKLMISSVLAVAFFFFIPVPPASHVVLSWDTFCLSQLVLLWWSMLKVSSTGIRSEAQRQDGSRVYIFIVSLLAALFSLFSVIQMILSAGSDQLYKALNLSGGIACMVLSWILVHTLFAIRYAHLYYAKDLEKKDKHAGGLDFPSHPEEDTPNWPDFMDFAYVSFTIGMTFQVSDVDITDKHIRKIALIHGLFSFAFNAAIIALSVNIISGLIEQ
ncbi:DUF1345 domain-containing protein [Arachidicoccus terrestris]|uniref:DUF1345 domain-containing protein n=1 Tax=Arachidicoccus terrestris TaxID=2875539 RepID=UPI001CC4E736|nr:DUF1345 domain-containing protein [Arachidicoccus terrestris]UAY55586.1 DUF1345 domain-containing protein [Arachidicoccus terrestris]